jgi:hypothetical protein
VEVKNLLSRIQLWIKGQELLLFYVLSTVLLMPWRNSSSQDDEAYAFSAISMAFGTGEPHEASVATVFPQIALGAALLKLVPFLPAISVLNFLTWVCFGLLIYISNRIMKLDSIFALSFFSFPIWFQCGSMFVYEVYGCLLLVSLLALATNPLKSRWSQNLCVLVISYLSGVQIQSFAAFPFFWGAAWILGKDRDRRISGASMVVGSLAALFSFMGVEKTAFQQGYLFWMLQYWSEQSPFNILKIAGLQTLQMLLGAGLFLVPLLQVRRVVSWAGGLALAFQVGFVLLLSLNGSTALSTGVLFTSYMPPLIGIGLISFGIWGWLGFWDSYRGSPKNGFPLWSTALALGALLGFGIFRWATDIRFFVVWSIVLLFYCSCSSKNAGFRLGYSRIYLALVLAVSLLANRYSLDTTSARWEAAREYENLGIPRSQISAGLGYNAFHREHNCIKLAKAKLAKKYTGPIWKEPEFFQRIINTYARSNEDEWLPRYVIKPSQMLGKRFDLKLNRSPGQDTEPVRRIPYTTFFLPNELSVFENQEIREAWCFR